MRQIVYLAGFSILLIAYCKPSKPGTALPYYNSPDFTPVFVARQENLNQKIPHRIGSFAFTDQQQQTITEKAIEGKIHVANFFFTSCGSICPKLTSGMSKVSKAYPDGTVVLLSYSVDPSTDNVAVLTAYAAKNNISNPNWHLLTGNKAKLYQLARTSYFAEEDLGFTKDSTNFLHTEHFLLVDKTKRIRGIYNGTLDLEIEQLIKDIDQLKKEK